MDTGWPRKDAMSEQTTSRVVSSPFLIVNPKATWVAPTPSSWPRSPMSWPPDSASTSSSLLNTSTSGWSKTTPNTWTVTAQHMDPIVKGRGMGYILPESLVEAGAEAVVLNHAEHQLTLDVLDATMRRAREVGLATIVCADSDVQCRAIATMGPDMMICEPTANIGTGRMDAGDYISRTTRIVKDVDPTILVIRRRG